MSRASSHRAWVALAVWLVVSALVAAAQQQAAPPAAPPTARASAPIDLTGYWVSIVTEDWRYRMMTPSKGDYASVPLNPAGRRAADAWDPAKDADSCKAYGAAAIMRMPGRLHITWEDDATLKLETDAGTQTRRLRFSETSAAAKEPDWQGSSIARWDGPLLAQRGRGGDQTGRDLGLGRGTDQVAARGAAAPTTTSRGGALEVVTTRMRAGYLRRNGVPYSERATLTEYFTRIGEPNGSIWLVVTSIVEDPEYLTQPFITSAHFRKEPDGSKWNPRPCQP